MAVSDPSTIVAIATPTGRGALGLIRLSGPEALRIGGAVFHVKHGLRGDGRVRRGRIVGADGASLDDALGWALLGPRTYTGQDTVELSTHGSPALLGLVVESACRHGARRAEPGEFTRRAFLNGRLDLVQAEAVADLIAAQSVGGFQFAYGALSGGLSARLRRIRAHVTDACAVVEAGLDFSEDVDSRELSVARARLEAARAAAAGLVETFASARQRLAGYRVAIVGPPNAGKSTLLNRWLGEERALVSETPGTTRDWIEAQVVWQGEVVWLVDTAGLRSTADPVEAEGVSRSWSQAAAADVVIYLVDGTAQSAPPKLGATWKAGSIVALNKADLSRRLRLAPDLEREAIAISARRGDGVEALQRRVLERLRRGAGDPGIGLLRERHVEGLQVVETATAAALRELEGGGWETAAEDLRRALQALASVLGESVDDAVLDRIFATFCVGK